MDFCFHPHFNGGFPAEGRVGDWVWRDGKWHHRRGGWVLWEEGGAREEKQGHWRIQGPDMDTPQCAPYRYTAWIHHRKWI